MKQAERKRVERQLQGIVIAAKSEKTITVHVERVFQHPVYKKIIKIKTKYQAHDEKNQCKPGDFVTIKQVRPISKTKRWLVVAVVATDHAMEVSHDSDAN